MRRTWLYLKLAVLLLFAVMMFANQQSNVVQATACSGSCKDECWFSTCCKCQTELACGCYIASGEKGCGSCSNPPAEE